MFDIGWSELLVIGIVALIVIGPKELPGVLRTVGQWMTQAPPHGVRVPGPVPRSDARSRDGRPQEGGRRDDRRRRKSYADFDPIGDMRKELDSTHQQIESAFADKPATAATTPAEATADTSSAPAAASAEATPAASEPAVAAKVDTPFDVDAPVATRRRQRPSSKPPVPRPRRSSPTREASPHEPRGRREGDRGHQGAADGAPDRAALAADQGADRVLRSRSSCCFFFAKHIYNILIWPFVWVAGAENTKFIYTALLEYFWYPAQARDVRRGLHLVPGDRRRRSTCSSRPGSIATSAGLPAVSGRDADLLRARRDGGLFPA